MRCIRPVKKLRNHCRALLSIPWRSSLKRRRLCGTLWNALEKSKKAMSVGSLLLRDFAQSSCLIFFSLAGHLVGFLLVGRVFRKGFRILGLGERKGRWAMEQDFRGDFQVNVTWFFASFSGVLDWIVLILVWFERSLHSAQVSGQSCPWPLKLMTSQRVQRTWIRRGGYRQFRGKWVELYMYFLLELFFSNFQNGPFSLIHWFFSILHGEQ